MQRSDAPRNLRAPPSSEKIMSNTLQESPVHKANPVSAEDVPGNDEETREAAAADAEKPDKDSSKHPDKGRSTK